MQRLLITENRSFDGSRAVAELWGRAIRADDEDELYRVIASSLSNLIPADRATIAFLVDGTDELEVSGLEGEQGRIPLGQRVPVQVSGPGAAVLAEQTQRWTLADFDGRIEAAWMSEAGLNAVIDAPLIVHGEAIGALSLARAGTGYEDHQARLLQDVADLVSANLERLRALATTRQQLASVTRYQRRLELLGQLGRRLSAALTEEDAFLGLAELAEGVLPVDRLSLAFPDTESDTFRIAGLRADGHAPSGLEAGDIWPMRGTGMAAVVEAGTMQYAPDFLEGGYPEHERLAASGMRSGLSIPVRSGGQVVAVLNSASAKVDAFEAEDLIAADAVAMVVGETLDRIRSRDALAVRDRQLAAIVDASPLLMMTLDAAGEIVQVSEFGASQLGYEVASLRGEPLSMLYPQDQRKLVGRRLADLSREPAGTVTSWAAWMVNAHGDRLSVRHTGRKLASDANGASTILVCEDVTALSELADKLEHEATHDPLTGIVNRREFDRRLSELIASTEAGVVGSVCYIDVDQFKIINDTAGHHAGDALLVELAKTLAGVLKPEHLIARLGGDEFAVILPRYSLTGAARLAERLRAAANQIVFSWEGRNFGTSISIGLAAIDPGNPDTDEVIGRADAACYDAKNGGRNQVSIASSRNLSDRSSRRDGEWGSRLRDALDQGHLELVGQKIVAVDPTDSRDRAELLVRSAEVDGELLPAGLFIPAAERLGIVSEVDRWVVSRAAELLTDDDGGWPDLDFVAVNLSPQSIESDDFLEHLIATLGAPGLDPSKLLFEITETAALSQFSKAVKFIETVADRGCRFALDDFGAGFSTFHYLKRLPVDLLKIDGSLIQDLAVDPIDRAIVRSIVDVAATLGMQTVAEFVDNSQTIDWLEELGVDFAQGFAIGHPQPID